MADDDGILRSIFTAYGIWAIIGAVVLGLVVWAASDLRAQPGSKVSVLWGMTSYTKSCSRDAVGACREEGNRCAKIGGRWEGINPASSSTIRLNLTQNGCIVYGSVENDVAPNSQRLSAALSDKSGHGFNKRTINGCTTYLAPRMRYYLKSSYKSRRLGMDVIYTTGREMKLHIIKFNNVIGDAFAFYAGDIRVEGPHPFRSSGGNLGNGRTRTAVYTDSIEQLRGTEVKVRAETALAAFTTPSSGGWIMFGKYPS